MSNNENPNPDTSTRARRGSFTSQTFNNIFGRSNSTSGAPTAPFPGPITTAAAQDQRRRMSISTLGLSGTSPHKQHPSHSEADEAASQPIAPIQSTRVPSTTTKAPVAAPQPHPSHDACHSEPKLYAVQAMAAAQAHPVEAPYTTSSKPNNPLPTIPSGPRSGGGAVSPPRTAQAQAQAQASTQSKPRTASDYPVSARTGEGGGFNWSEQLRSRAESSVSQSQRPSFSTSPTAGKPAPFHERTKSASEMPTPPMAVPPSCPGETCEG